MEAQRKVADSVAKRGYRGGWTAEQFLARQIVKMIEEVAELASYVAPKSTAASVFFSKLWMLGAMARKLFDDEDAWDCEIIVSERDAGAIGQELADGQVVWFNIAETYAEWRGAPFDVVQAAVDKAAGDEARGRRGGGTR